MTPHPEYDRICANCGLTFGSHRGDNICRDQCPAHEGRMDWPAEGVTTFRPSGAVRRVPYGTPAFGYEAKPEAAP